MFVAMCDSNAALGSTMPDETESKSSTYTDMRSVYMETRFRMERKHSEWPEEFVILSAYATTGQTWTHEQNRTADRQLEAEMRALGGWLVRIEGYSPSSGHCEPSWATVMPLGRAIEVGKRYKQDAIFHVHDEKLTVVYCDGRRPSQPVASFLSRLDGRPNESDSRDALREPTL